MWFVAYLVLGYLLLGANMDVAIGYPLTSLLGVMWLVLMFPCVLAGHLFLLSDYMGTGWEYAFTATNALL